MNTIYKIEAVFLFPVAILHLLFNYLERLTRMPTVEVVQPLAPEPAAAIAPPALSTLTVVELRSLARAQLGASHRVGGRRIAQATRIALLDALG